MVPSVCPGVRYSVSVVSPSVSFMPSVATMSRFGFQRGILLIEQIVVGSRHDQLRSVRVLQILRAAGVIQMAVADDHVLDLRRIETDLLHAAR